MMFCLLLLSAALSAQVNVTYQVDITDYLAGGATLAPNGIRIAGNFTTVGAAIPDWAPADPAGAMTDLGNNVWSITVTYPSTSIGTDQLFKFVNGDWGQNEGLAGSEIATGGCGVDDGAGNINRVLTVPATDVGYQWCWDKCTRCDGSDPLISGFQEVDPNAVTLTNYPNPVADQTVISYTLNAPAKSVILTIYNSVGQVIAQSTRSNQGTSLYTYTWNSKDVSNGVYFYSLNADGKISTNKFIVAK